MAETKKCDCLNDCGDDPDIRTGKVKACDRAIAYWRHQRLVKAAPILMQITKTLIASVDAVENGQLTGAYLSSSAPLIIHARDVIAQIEEEKS